MIGESTLCQRQADPGEMAAGAPAGICLWSAKPKELLGLRLPVLDNSETPLLKPPKKVKRILYVPPPLPRAQHHEQKDFCY